MEMSPTATRSRSRSDTQAAPLAAPLPAADSDSRQGVADEADGVDEGRPELLELLAQVAHVGLDDIAVAAEVVVPDVVEDLRLREHVARVEHEVAQQVELRGGEVDDVPAASHLVRTLIELDVGEAQDAVVLGLVPRPTQDGVDPGDDLGQREGLGDVVVAAHGEAGQLVLERVARGQEEDGDAHAVGAQAAGDLESVEVGEHDIEDDEVGRILLGLGECLAPRHGLVDGEPLVAQRRGHCIDD